MKRFINWIKMEWEIFQFADSVEANNMTKNQIDKKIESIKKTYRNNL